MIMAAPLPSCSILVVSSDAEESKNLVNRIITTSSSKDAEVQAAKTEHVPWTISNKYYTAPVHFTLKEIQEINSDLVAEVPAFIFVFDPIEDYQDIFTRLLRSLRDSDFEVSLAVSVSKAGAVEPTEDQEQIYESYFSSLGFEYVRGHTSDIIPSQEQDIDNLDGVPGLGRVIDALSTILWPSMVRKTRHAKTRSVIHIANEEEGLRSLLNADPNSSGLSARQQEMAMLEKWLEGAISNEGDWKEAQDFSLDSEEDSSSKRPGFDDNFSDFVSASTSNSNNEPELPSRREVEETTRLIMELEKNDRHRNDDDDDDDDEGHFDLTQVLAGLELMKSEIANIQDDHERRRAAAKVALSLAYGLDKSDLSDQDVL